MTRTVEQIPPQAFRRGAQTATPSAGGAPDTREPEGIAPPRVRVSAATRPSAPKQLTAREATIARMLVEGMDERQVAAELFLGAVALRAHLARICAKLDIPSPLHLVTVIGRGTMLEFDHQQVDRTVGCPDRQPAIRVRLTPQEGAVLRLLRGGLDARAVAAELFIGIDAVRSHVAHIQEKLGTEGSTRH
ncbi:MAG TPA: helix-turn-helix transcriptional regulator [Microlunatus sp.]